MATRFLALVLACFLLGALMACSSSGGGGGGGNSTGSASTGCAAASEGSFTTPQALTLETARSGSVSCAGVSWYVASGIAADTYTVVELTGLSDDITLYTLERPFEVGTTGFGSFGCVRRTFLTSATGPTARCHARPTVDGTVYVAVIGQGAGTAAITYSIRVTNPAEPVSEGSDTGPQMAITSTTPGQTARTSDVAACKNVTDGHSYYHFTVDMAVNNSILITASDSGLNARLYTDNTDFTDSTDLVTNPNQLDAITDIGGGISFDILHDTLLGPNLYLKTDSCGADDALTYTLDLATPSSLHNADDNNTGPHPITVGTQQDVEVQARNLSGYTTAATEGTVYLATLTEDAGVANLVLNAGAFGSGIGCAADYFNSPSLTKTCRVLVDSSATISVGDNGNSVAGGTTGTLLVESTGVAPAEGTLASPVSLGAAPIHGGAHTVSDATSYYSASVTPGATYLVSLTPDQAVSMEVFDGAAFTGSPYCTQTGSAGSAFLLVCPIVPTGNTLYVKVDGSLTGGAGAAFALNVME